MPHLIKANRDFNTNKVGQCLDYIFFLLYYFFFQIVVIVQCMHIIYQMKENLSVCVNIFFKINIKKKDGVENYFCKVRFFFQLELLPCP